MPVNTPEIKVNNVRKLGGIVELVGESYQETQVSAPALPPPPCPRVLQTGSFHACMGSGPCGRPAQTVPAVEHSGVLRGAGASQTLTRARTVRPQAYAVEKAVREGLTFIPPYDDPHTISGQGTIGDEILRQVRSARAHACNMDVGAGMRMLSVLSGAGRDHRAALRRSEGPARRGRRRAGLPAADADHVM